MSPDTEWLQDVSLVQEDYVTETTEPIDNMPSNPATPPIAGPPDDAAAEGLDAVQSTVEAGKQAAADAAAASESTALEVVGAPSSQSGSGETTGEAGEQATIMDRLASDSEFDPDATNDDRVMAALAYATQLLLPFIVPIIILISETSKRRPFQRYHAIQSIGVAVVIYGLELALVMAASVSAATIILWLCLCFILPAMIALWLLPLYYAILAYNGKRFRVPGLTQFLQDQRWL